MEEFTKGLISGFIGSVILSPLDLIRTRYQLRNNSFKELGIRSLYRGALGSCSCQSMFWGIYFGLDKTVPESQVHARTWLIATTSSWLSNPLFVFRTRVQSLEYLDRTPLTVMKDTMALRDPWTRGLKVTAVHNMQFVPMFELKKRLSKKEHQFWQSVLVGSFSKLVASSLFYPWEVYRTNLRMDARMTLTEFLRLGPRACFAGYLSYVARTVPQTGITLALYDKSTQS